MAHETAACIQGRAPVASLGYTPRNATGTVLHQVVREHLESFLATATRAPIRAGSLRYRLAWDHVLCRAVLTTYARALLGFERRRARRRGIGDGRSGTVTAIQRFGGDVQLNVHFHTLLLEGVFARQADGTSRFQPAPPPTDREVARLLATIRTRILRLLRRLKLSCPHVRRRNPTSSTSPDAPRVTYGRPFSPTRRARASRHASTSPTAPAYAFLRAARRLSTTGLCACGKRQ